MLGWFARHGFGLSAGERDLLTACAGAQCALMITPGAPEDLLIFSSTYIVWGLVADTSLDHGDLSRRKARYQRLAPQFLRALNDPWSGPDGLEPIAALLRELRLYLEGRTSPAQIRRWADAHAVYLTGVACELLNADQGTLPTLDDYLYLRTYTAAGPTGTALVDLCTGPGPTASDLETGAVRALGDAASMVMAFLGDLASAGKETDLEYNLLNVIQRDLSCSRFQAMDHAVHICDQIIELFCELRERTLPTVTPCTAAYLTGLGTLIRGVLDWVDLVPRYTTFPRITPAPAASRIDARRLPSIAHWWNLL
jgi:hypothetical protein